MNRAEMKKALVIDKLIAHLMTTSEAADSLGITTRQVLRLKAKVVMQGSEALAHGNRGRAPAHTVSDDIRQQIIQLYTDKYHGANRSHLSDLLAEHDRIQVSPSTVGRILTQVGIAPIRQRRRAKVHRPRDRKPQAGMLWQIDASTHAWLEDRGPVMALHGAIDDATGMVTAAVFRPTEDLIGYLTMMEKGIRQYGVPLALYSDQHTIFFCPQQPLSVEEELAGETEALSQFGYALSELGIEHIRARTPQAKGRIERLWQTFQDRLLIELRIRHVFTLEGANAVLDALVAQHNVRFAVLPVDSGLAYVAAPADKPIAHIICLRETRTVTPAQTVSYHGKLYSLRTGGQNLIPARTVVYIRKTVQGELVVYHGGIRYELYETQSVRRAVAPLQKDVEIERKPHKPAANHPWRTPYKKPSSVKSTAIKSV